MQEMVISETCVNSNWLVIFSLFFLGSLMFMIAELFRLAYLLIEKQEQIVFLKERLAKEGVDNLSSDYYEFVRRRKDESSDKRK